MTIAIQRPGHKGWCAYCQRRTYVYWTCDKGNRLRICAACVRIINGGTT